MSLDMSVFSPNGWTVPAKSAEISKITLDENSKEFDKYWHKFFFKYDGLPVHPERIIKVLNPYVYGRFSMRQLEYQARGGENSFATMELFHATGRNKVTSILKNNLDWRMVKRAKFGRGVSFSPSPKYANMECNKKIGSSRTMIVCDVLVGKTSRGHRNQDLPHSNADTTTDSAGSVYVKYRDDEFYPKYLIEYSI